jgi:hypothetical protein
MVAARYSASALAVFMNDSNEGTASSSLSLQQIEAISRAFDFLFNGLREARCRFESGNESGRDGAIHALETVLKFLSHFEPTHAEAPHSPLVALFDALMH